MILLLQAFAMSCKELCPVLGEDASEEHIVSFLYHSSPECLAYMYVQGHNYSTIHIRIT